MRRLISLLWIPALGVASPWPHILAPLGGAEVTVFREDGAWRAAAQSGKTVVLEAVAPGKILRRVMVKASRDLRRPDLAIYWERPVEVAVPQLPPGAQVFQKEAHTGAPLMAGWREGEGAVLWLAAEAGERGYERFPYLLQALADLGVAPRLRANDLWAFFDSSYRLRADPEFLAARWRASGIAGLHIAAWQYDEPTPQQAEYLERLLAACRKNRILAYAWIELPHVSDAFWHAHPECREKTALGTDAHLDWRRLMDLVEPRCAELAAGRVERLLRRFDWDGVNLAELYFESLEGLDNPARFTPMSAAAREAFRREGGFDPIELFRGKPGRETFLAWRAALAAKLQKEWLERVRKMLPEADLVLTHIDDRYDATMREKLGADSARVVPLLGTVDATLLVEDPAPLWHLGPQRYPEIARRYAPLVPAIDINIVERYQDVYPTKQQTGVELFQLVHESARAFARVALYFEYSIDPVDLPLLSAAAAAAEIRKEGESWVVQAARPLGVNVGGPVTVNGRPWPVHDERTVWLPAGKWKLHRAEAWPEMGVRDLNARLLGAVVSGEGVEFRYESGSRALALLNKAAIEMRIDGKRVTPGERLIRLPRGRHTVWVK